MATTVRQLLKDGTARLGRIIKDNPRLTAEYLLQSLLQLRKIDLYLEPERQVTATIEAEFWSKVGRKVDREPLQYIIGETEWYGVTLKCDPRALIPRPETEIITERAVELLKDRATPLIADIGTGSGAIAIAMALELPDAQVIATDSSVEALALAEQNVTAHQLSDRIQLRPGSLLEALDQKEPFDLIISNPPYIRIGEYPGLMPEVRDHEPALALVAGEDGLDVIHPLISTAPDYLKAGGWLVLEFGVDHARPVSRLANHTGKYGLPTIVIDYNQQERGAVLQRV